MRRRSGKDRQQPYAIVRQDTGRKASRVLSSFVIAYYLQYSRVVEDYLSAQALAAKEVRREVESRADTRGLRERLRHRRAQAAA